MNSTRFKAVFAAPAMLAGMLALAACESETEAPIAAEEEDTIPGIEISDARLVLAPVEGNPAAVYFDLSYDGTRGIAIRSAEVEGAGSADVHDVMEYDFEMQMNTANPIALTQGTEVAFEPGGKHIMVFEPSDTLQPGTTTEVTLIVSGGDRHTFDAEIREAGEDR